MDYYLVQLSDVNLYVQVIQPRCFGELHNQLRQIESNLSQFTLMFRHRVVLTRKRV